MSYEINIVLGILYCTKNIHFTLCLHASDEISGSDVDMLFKDFKNSILWFCIAIFPKSSTHMDFCPNYYTPSAVRKVKNVFCCKIVCYSYTCLV